MFGHIGERNMASMLNSLPLALLIDFIIAGVQFKVVARWRGSDQFGTQYAASCCWVLACGNCGRGKLIWDCLWWHR